MKNVTYKYKVNHIVLAFTLAEVLIVLGIIGVVAAFTIPTLMKKIQDWDFKNAAKVAFSKSSQAVQKMNEDFSGVSSTFNTSNPGKFKDEFMKYFKVMKDCGISNCVPSSTTSSIYKSLSGISANTYEGGEGQFVTTDGMVFNIEDTIYSNVMIIVDVNGYLKKPNVYGKDTFTFQIIDNTLVPMGKPGTLFPATTYCDKTKNNNYQGLGCTYYVMQGIDY